MFRDAKEELERLESELLAEEEVESQEEKLLPEETLDELLQDTRAVQSGGVYSNFSNGYGRNLRNYASGYQAYNSDKCDEDLDTFSEAVRAPKRSGLTGWVVLALLLLAGIFAVLIWYLVQYGGIL